MPGIVLCPNCHVRAEKDDLGELLCPKCGARLCPKAHIVDGKICPHCGWEDPNYFLWREGQKLKGGQQGITYSRRGWPNVVSRQSSGVVDALHQYNCQRAVCGGSVDPETGRCTKCGQLHDKGLLQKMHQQAMSAAPPARTTAPPTPPQRPQDHQFGAAHDTGARYNPPEHDYTSYGYGQSGAPVSAGPTYQDTAEKWWKSKRSAYQDTADKSWLKRISGTITPSAPREWSIPPLARRLLIIGFWAAAFLAIGFGGYHAVTQLGNVSPPSTSTSGSNTIPISTPAQTYTLSTKVAPQAAGWVHMSPKSETYDSDTEVTLKATAAPGYAFDCWDGDASGSSATFPVIMDSDKNVTAYFKVKDTTPLAISEVAVPSTSDLTATITWETNEDATSQVEYWTTDADSKSTQLDDSRQESHTVRLTGLEPNTTYYFRVKSKDASGNEAISRDRTLKTLRAIPVGHEVGKRAPDFTLPSYQDDNPESPNKGQIVKLSDSQGKKVLLNFWSTFCGSCLIEFPFIRAAYDNHGKNSGDVAVITVCIDTRAYRIKKLEDRIEKLETKFSDEIGHFTFPILLDKEAGTKDSYNISTVPRTFFIDSEGIIREIKIGRFDSQEEIESILESL